MQAVINSVFTKNVALLEGLQDSLTFEQVTVARQRLSGTHIAALDFIREWQAAIPVEAEETSIAYLTAQVYNMASNPQISTVPLLLKALYQENTYGMAKAWMLSIAQGNNHYRCSNLHPLSY